MKSQPMHIDFQLSSWKYHEKKERIGEKKFERDRERVWAHRRRIRGLSCQTTASKSNQNNKGKEKQQLGILVTSFHTTICEKKTFKDL
jgi:hypothetical protein